MKTTAKARVRALAHHYANRAQRLAYMAEYAREYNKTPRRKFNDQRQNARSRGIDWQLTFEQWIAWWGDDLQDRGNGPTQLCMARVGDAGPYALGNIFKQRGRFNSGDGSRKRWSNVA